MDSLMHILAVEGQRRPNLLRNAVDLMRRRKPIWVLGKTVIVLSDGAVRSVLGRPRDFLNCMAYAPKLKLGALALGMDISPRYELERAASEDVLAVPARVTAFAKLVADCARQRLDTRRQPASKLDFVSELVEPAVTQALCDLFEIAYGSAQSSHLAGERGLDTFRLWLRNLGGTIGAALPIPFGLDALSEATAREFRAHLAAQITSSEPRSVAPWHQAFGSADQVIRCLGGTLMAAAALFKASTLALEQLIEHQRVAVLLQGAGERQVLAQHVIEALRFAPPFPFLVRHCARSTELHGTAIEAGSKVMISPLSAMFDPSAVDNPDQFWAGRPTRTYLLFGGGRHECVALQMATEALCSVLGELFAYMARHRLHIARSGRVRYDGPSVRQFELDLRLERAA